MTLDQEIQRIKQRYAIIGDAPALTIALERALQVAPINVSVLIIGESGAGKEFFPKIIHDNSSRKHGKYIAVNCGAIPEGTVDSELFGHEKGSFTGAVSSRKGYFEEADGGTIFLDEVAELPLTTQARLLRVLESGEYIRVGSNVAQKTNIRVVAATNKDMLKAVADGKFREDLYYRLSTVQINIPPLRERGDDIKLLVRKFSSDFSNNYKTPSVKFGEDAKEALKAYRWPGNVRQLKNIIEQVALFEAGKTVDRKTLLQYLPVSHDGYMPAVAQQSQFDYNQERELLFKMILQLQQELANIKEALNRGGMPSHVSNDITEIKRDSTSLIKLHPSSGTTFHHGATQRFDDAEANDVHDVTATPVETVQEVKSLEETERDTIIKTLERNQGKRKKTAHDLKISERTLYRKIKEYGLDKRNNS